MADIKKEEKTEKIAELTFLQKLGKRGYVYAEVCGTIQIIDHPDPERYLTLGFEDANGFPLRVMTIPWPEAEALAKFIANQRVIVKPAR